MIMYTCLSLRNFKGIVRGKLELGRVNILLGANNSGKTTILEALFLLPNPLRYVPYSIVDSRGSLRQLRAVEVLNILHKTLSSSGYAFILNNYTAERGEISIEIDGDLLKMVLNSPKILDTIDIYYIKGDARYSIGELKKYSSEIRIERDAPESIGDTLIKSIGEAVYIHPRILHLLWGFISHKWSEIINLGLSANILRTLRDAINVDYSDFTLEPYGVRGQSIYVRMVDGKRIRLGDIGDGFQSILTIMLIYEFVRPVFLLIDDIESHLNPQLATFFARWLHSIAKNESLVIIASTHSIETALLLSEVLEDYNLRIILVSIVDGELRTKVLSPKELEEFRKSGIDPRLYGVIL